LGSLSSITELSLSIAIFKAIRIYQMTVELFQKDLVVLFVKNWFVIVVEDEEKSLLTSFIKWRAFIRESLLLDISSAGSVYLNLSLTENSSSAKLASKVELLIEWSILKVFLCTFSINEISKASFSSSSPIWQTIFFQPNFYEHTFSYFH
jgi:hypothetical protein